MEIFGLVLSLLGIAFAFEKPRKIVLSVFGLRSNKSTSILPYEASTPAHRHEPASSVFGAVQSGRYPFFIEEPISNMSDALVCAKSTGKPIFLVIYDEVHPTRSQLYYSLGCFMDYFTTKRLVQDHFVVALVSSADEKALRLVPENDPLENCLWVVLRPDGKVLRREGMYASADEGLKRVREVVALNAHV